MIVVAALCPSAPLLAAELTGDEPNAAAVRAAAGAAVAAITAPAVDVVAVVGVADGTREWPSTGRPDLAPYGGRPLPDGADPVPPGVGLGALLLDVAGYAGNRLLWTVGRTEPPDRYTEVAATVANSAARVALLVLGDGSARRTLKAPGYLDERATPFDATIGKSIMDGDLAALRHLDPALAADLMVTGWPAFQVLASAVPYAATTTTHYCDAPFGVGYFVASFTAPQPGP